MKTALLTGLVLLAGLPAGADEPNAPQLRAECKPWYGKVVPKHRLEEIDARCPYSVKELSRLTVQVRYPVTLNTETRAAPARPAVSPEMLELMRLDLERRQMELDRLERMRRERANRDLGMFMLRQVYRRPVYVAPPPVNLQERNTHLLIQEYLRNELARQRREELLGPYD